MKSGRMIMRKYKNKAIYNRLKNTFCIGVWEVEERAG